MFGHACLIGVGLVLIIGGFWGSDRFPSPYDAWSAWGAPVGLLVMLAGITLSLIPDFFG